MLTVGHSAATEKVVTVTTDRSGDAVNIQPFNLFKKKPKEQAQAQPAGSAASTQSQQCPFSIDPRWGEWNSNSVLLLKAGQRAGETNNFLHKQRYLVKYCYVRAFAKYEQEGLAPDSRSAKAIEKLKAERDTLVQRLDAQERFQNAEIVNDLNTQIRAMDFEINSLHSKNIGPLPPHELAGLLSKELISYSAETEIGDAIFRVAYALPPRGETAKDPITWSRERLAEWANRPGTSQEVLNKALAFDRQLKQIQDNLAAGRVRRAQETATLLWNSLLD